MERPEDKIAKTGVTRQIIIRPEAEAEVQQAFNCFPFHFFAEPLPLAVASLLEAVWKLKMIDKTRRFARETRQIHEKLNQKITVFVFF